MCPADKVTAEELLHPPLGTSTTHDRLFSLPRSVSPTCTTEDGAFHHPTGSTGGTGAPSQTYWADLNTVVWSVQKRTLCWRSVPSSGTATTRPLPTSPSRTSSRRGPPERLQWNTVGTTRCDLKEVRVPHTVGRGRGGTSRRPVWMEEGPTT